jgi:hypothetical protein
MSKKRDKSNDPNRPTTHFTKISFFQTIGITLIYHAFGYQYFETKVTKTFNLKFWFENFSSDFAKSCAGFLLM